MFAKVDQNIYNWAKKMPVPAGRLVIDLRDFEIFMTQQQK